MIKQLLCATLILLAPVGAHAADGSLQVTEGSGSADQGASNVLQPANPQTLQPTGSGIQVPDEQRLQTSATRDQIAAILSGESAGSRKTSTPEEEGIDLPIIPLVLGLFILGFVGSYFFDKYKTKQGNVATVGPALSKAIKEKEVPKKKPKAKGTRQAKAKARAKKSPKTS